MRDIDESQIDDLHIDKQRQKWICYGLEEDENFRAMTKVGEFYTKFVDVFEQIIDENK